jgi:predicted nucleotidyltransferase
MSLFDVFDLGTELEKQTDVKVDLVTKINRNFKEYIEPELIDFAI